MSATGFQPGRLNIAETRNPECLLLGGGGEGGLYMQSYLHWKQFTDVVLTQLAKLSIGRRNPTYTGSNSPIELFDKIGELAVQLSQSYLHWKQFTDALCNMTCDINIRVAILPTLEAIHRY